MDRAVIEDYKYVIVMDAKMNWMKLAHMFVIFFSTS